MAGYLSVRGKLLTPEFAVMGILTAPGKTTVTRTLIASSSEYSPSVKSFTAALAAP